MLALLAGLWTGLARLGWPLPLANPALIAAHGPLMIVGFLGTLISLERAVALRAIWAYFAPLLTGLGAIALLLSPSQLIGPTLMTLGSLCLTIIYVFFLLIRLSFHTAIMAIGAFSWLIGNISWSLGEPVSQVLLWWVGFLLLTIAGERLELSRLLRLTAMARTSFIVSISLLLTGMLVSPLKTSVGSLLAGIGMIALAFWLGHYDIARQTLRRSGLPRFTAICLITGYIWLGLAGVLMLFSDWTVRLVYDAWLHAFFLGFIFSMIFGHAPIIFPAVLGVRMPFSSRFYVHLVLLHLSLALRVIGDLSPWLIGRQIGGILNVAAILVFIGSVVFAIIQGRSSSVTAQSECPH
jgi:hypothetical protein